MTSRFTRVSMIFTSSCLHLPALMASPNRTDSPASKAFADKLAKYAYDPSSSGSPRKSLRLHVAGPSVVASPVQGRKGSRRDTVTAPEAEKSGAEGQAGAEAETDDGEEEEEEEEYNPSPSRKRTSSRTTPIKNVKKPRPFAAPEVYAHLRPVNDHLKPDLNSTFVLFYQWWADLSHLLRYQVGPPFALTWFNQD